MSNYTQTTETRWIEIPGGWTRYPAVPYPLGDTDPRPYTAAKAARVDRYVRRCRA